jgi:hypothetical protein
MLVVWLAAAEVNRKPKESEFLQDTGKWMVL